MNPFKAHKGNPGPGEVNSHESLWVAMSDLRIDTARLEERVRYNWLLSVAALTGQVAILSLIVVVVIAVVI